MHDDPAPAPLFSMFPPVSTDAWEEQIQRDLRGADYTKKLVWHTPDGFDVRPYYRAEDLAALDHLAVISALLRAGEGARPGAWEIRQDVHVPVLTAANEAARRAREEGASALGFVLVPAAEGIPVQTAADFAALVDGLPLAEVLLHFTAGPAALAILALWRHEAARQGVDPAALRGTVDLDPLGQQARTGALPPERTWAWLGDALRRVAGDEAGVRLLCVDSSPYHEAGATAGQELGLAMASLSEYLAILSDQGVAPEMVLRHLHCVVPVGTSYFLEIAKLRAFRLLVAQVAAAFLPERKEPLRPYVQAVTSRRCQTLYDPYVNLLRGTTAAAAAVLGGCDTLCVRPFDEAFRTPDAFSYRLARNTQLLLRHEAAFDRVRDPAAGAYYIEQLTDRFARAGWSYFQQIEAAGGLGERLRAGTVQRDLAAARSERQRDAAQRKRVLVGTNQYPNPEEDRLEDAVYEAPAASVGPLLRPGPTDLDALTQAFSEGARLHDLLDAAEDAPDAEPLPSLRDSAAFEALRLRTERFAQRTGRAPAVFLLPLGNVAMRTARATFSRNFFGCAGFRIHDNLGFATVDEGVAAARASGAEIVVLCSADEEYPALAPPACEALKAQAPLPLVVVAGYPADQVDALRQAGVDDFIHLRANLLETLGAFHERLGIHND